MVQGRNCTFVSCFFVAVVANVSSFNSRVHFVFLCFDDRYGYGVMAVTTLLATMMLMVGNYVIILMS